ncbi:DUF2628 domain-containing protein [Delftia lacustris]|uniref:DUF2628 domain-containing protein n=1 Tax=Delftia TaxID=80865 RepID=UPI000B134EF2|nr:MULTISPECIES: DUF2628 domain-containing protein [Delftia]MDH1827544.1 DUF2628 domain-containing protein [Delftia tsuruhatensis]QRI92586.1 DUF2628 domain-containing protein [Delftia lacustris]
MSIYSTTNNDKRNSHTMQEKYNVVLSGKHPAADTHQVAQKLATLFKCTPEQAGRLLSQASCVVKKDVTADAADKYKRAIESTGAQCIIQLAPQEAPLDFDVVPVLSAVSVSPSPSVFVGEVGMQVSSGVAADAIQAPATVSTPASAPIAPPAVTPAPAMQPRSAPASSLLRQEAIQIFVGKNHDYFERKWKEAAQRKHQLSWNWAAFLVGFGWMGYRKMYLYSWIFIGVVAAELIAELAIGIPSSITSSINLGIAIGFGLKGNAWYLQHVNQRVDQILATHAPEQARIELARQGNTNIGAAVGFVAALLVLLGMIGVIAEG